MLCRKHTVQLGADSYHARPSTTTYYRSVQSQKLERFSQEQQQQQQKTSKKTNKIQP